MLTIGRTRSSAPLCLVVASALFLFTPALNADAIYTFSRTGSDPYSFSFTLPGILTSSTHNLGVTPLATPFFTLRDSALGVYGSGSGFCFSVVTGGDAYVSDTDSCGFSHPSGSLGLIAVFNNANAPGIHLPIASTASISGRSITQLVIEENTAPVTEPASVFLIGTGIAWVLARWSLRS
jgi:hypothetical protein